MNKQEVTRLILARLKEHQNNPTDVVIGLLTVRGRNLCIGIGQNLTQDVLDRLQGISDRITLEGKLEGKTATEVAPKIQDAIKTVTGAAAEWI